jgi:Secretion system C-terminal sorting domain
VQRGQPFNPAYTATYTTFIASVPFNDPNISVVVNNPSVVSYNATQKYFVGLDTLSTFAVVSYKGKKDTIYFSVTDTLRTTVATENEQSTAANSIAMKLYPNPTQGQFTFAVENTMLENATITVFNLVGQTISEQRISGQSATLDLTLEPQGMYFVRLRTEKQGEITQKIQKF